MLCLKKIVIDFYVYLIYFRDIVICVLECCSIVLEEYWLIFCGMKIKNID